MGSGRPGCAFDRPPVTSLTVSSAEPAEDLKALVTTLASIESVLDPDAMRAQLAALEADAADPDLWNDQDRAQRVTRRMASLRADLGRLDALHSRLDDLGAAIELEDPDLLAEAATELPTLQADIEQLEIRTLLSGEYDERDALITINSGTGGTDAADWAEMLMRMYLRWAERHDYASEVFDTSYAEEAGIKSATFVGQGAVRLRHARRRARRAPAGADLAVRQPVAAPDVVRRRRRHPGGRGDRPRRDPRRRDPGRRLPVVRARGQGSTPPTPPCASRHLPTGIVVTCQNERSQIQNRARAMEVLAAKLLELRRQEAADEMGG